MTEPLSFRRRDRVLEAMAARGLDTLVLGRADNTFYASGMRGLWTAGTRPFGAGCVVIAETGRTHVLSTSDAGLPETMTKEDLYSLTWNPQVMAGHLAAIEGFAESTLIGVDEVSPSFERAMARIAPRADIVPADDLMAEVRRIKFDEEIERVEAACAVAWSGVEAVLQTPGNPNPIGTAIVAMAKAGTTVPASAPTVLRRGDETIIDLGVLLDGYEGGVGGTFVYGQRQATAPIVDACRSGANHADLANAAAGPWLVRGLGMGFENPVLDPGHGHREVLESGMVLSVSHRDHRDVIAVTDGPPRILSTRPASL
ncbi:MAG: hypothetical protein F4Y27_01420 [Acidimicrobiaceae bacterium]|nr:hypothetical protein [Acidimicrobiaceae bacterium]MYA73326.1 hypothetical protein [Acidimicrobiaceae bacterium]MYD07386.1 hypothetical protein [Acidimicrobiaceae bacterium]MYG56658.1 hypothetical protein [Acidimicrobiaceae bacterium]MYI59531.1 hypothetical protein [Acidimicrobiaceae bacterium]